MGLVSAVAMGAGLAIGSGVFTAPQNLAAVADPITGLAGWVISTIATGFILLSFANVSSKLPVTGGAGIYAQMAFGDFWGFIVTWVYWVGTCTAMAALITACVRYLTTFFPILGESGAAAFATSTLLLWLLTWANIRGIKYGASIQIVTMLIKLTPIALFICLALTKFNPSLLHTVSPVVQQAGHGRFAMLAATVGITFWAFIGVEGATTTAEEIKNPEKNLKRSIFISVALMGFVYIAVSFLAAGIMPQAALADSKAPIAEMINLITGSTWGGLFVGLTVAISTLGSTNGLVIQTSRIAYGASELGIFPRMFSKVSHRYATPVSSLVLNSLFANALLFTNYVKSLNAAFTFTMLLATMTFMVPYAATCLAEMVLVKQYSKKITVAEFVSKSFIPLVAFLFILYIIYGTGAESVMWGFLLLLFGIPIYAFLHLRKQKELSRGKG